jgi:hypothetical protein
MTVRKIFESVEDDSKRAELFGKEVGDPEIHVDGAWGLTYVNGICKLNFYTVTSNTDENIERREVAVRISMILPTFVALRDLLIKQCDTLAEKGVLDPVAPPKAAPPEAPPPEAASRKSARLGKASRRRKSNN